MTVVDNAIYLSGGRTVRPDSLDSTYELLHESGGMAWIGLYRPDVEEMTSVAKEFGIHALALRDAVCAHQRAKLERYDGVLFTALRPVRYLDAEERIEFGELHVIIGADFVVTVRHAESPDLARVRRRVEGDPDLLRLGPEAVLYAVFDEVVSDYGPVITGLQGDIDEIEDQVFNADTSVSRRIYELIREVTRLQRATGPLPAMLGRLQAGFTKYDVDPELQRYLRNVESETLRIVERVEGFRTLLQNILTVNSTMVSERSNQEARSLTEASFRQNEQVKRISGWAAILFAPTLVGTIYGMNFDHMPELAWRFGYPLSLVLMALMAVTIYAVFKRKRWL